MRTKIIVFALIISLVLAGCAGKKKIEMPKEGVTIDLGKSAGKRATYRALVQKYIQTSEQGVSISRLIKGDVNFTIDFDKPGESQLAVMKYTFNNISVGVFVNQQLAQSEEVEEMKGLSFTAIVDTSGAISDIEGLELEEELKKKEISPLDFLFQIPKPDKPVTVGYTWKQDQDTVVEEKDGKVEQHVSVQYTVVDFVEYNGRRCIVFNTKGNVKIIQVGPVEQYGETYDVDLTMTGDVKGEVWFDIDNGIVVRYKNNKMIDAKGKQTDSKGETTPITYYNQETIETQLQ